MRACVNGKTRSSALKSKKILQMSEYITNIGFQIRLKELIGGGSVRSFARKCGLPESTIRSYLAGKRAPIFENIEKIAKACGRSVNWLTTGAAPSIVKMTNDELRKTYELDPEVIRVDEHDGGLYPVVRAYDDGNTQVHFFCIHCNFWHHHGRGGKGLSFEEAKELGGGHRVAHCVAKNSPFRLNGVVLEIIDKQSNLKVPKKDGQTLMCPKCKEYYSAAFNACDCGYVNKNRKSSFQEISNIYMLSGDGSRDIETDDYPTDQNTQKVAATIEPGNPEKKKELLSYRKRYAAPAEQTITPGDESFDEDQAIEQTRYVLRSDTVYRSALVSNIRAFYQGVKREEEMQGVEHNMKEMKDQLNRLEKMIESLGGLIPEKRASSDS